jgi:hypothetical protein
MSTAAPLKVHHSMGWSPASRLGRWTLGLAGLAVAGTAALAIAFSAGLEAAESFSHNWLLTAAGLAVLGVALASVATGLLALTARHDRSWAVVLATVAGMALSALFLQQVAEGLGWLSA